MLDAEFPDDWRRVRLEEVAEVRTGLAKGKKDVKDPVRRPYLRVANVQDGHLDLREVKHITVARAEVDRYTLADGDILLTEGGDADKLGRGTQWRNEVPGCLHQNHIFVVRVRPDQLLPEHLVWLTNSPHGREYFRRCSKQSTNLASINTRQLKRYPLVLPCIVEQRGIARVLSGADRSLAVVQALLKARRKLKRGLLQQLLTGQRRFPEFRKKQWVERPLSAFFTEVDVSNANGAETLVLSCTKLYGIISQMERFERRIASASISHYKVVRRGQLVYDPMLLWDRSIGFVKGYDSGVVSPAYATFTMNGDAADQEFFEALFDSHFMRHQYKVISKGTNQRRRKAEPRDFLGVRVLVPPTVEEQRRIGEFVRTCDQELDGLKALHSALKQQKTGLMQRLLTGQVRVPASVLKEAAHA